MRKLLLLGVGLAILAALTLYQLFDNPPLPADAAQPGAAPDSGASEQAFATGVADAAATRAPLALAADPPQPGNVYPADRPHGTLTGRVLDERGRPVRDARVLVLADPVRLPLGHALRDDRSVRAELRTGAGGSFRVDRIPAGPYIVRAVTQDGRRAAQQIALRGQGTPEHVELQLRAHEPGDDFAVVVVDSAGGGIADARVAVVGGVSGEGLIGMDGVPPLRATTDAQGRCVFSELRLEGAVVTATAADGRIGRATLFRRDAVLEAMASGGLVVRIDAPARLQGRLVGVAPAELAGARVQAHALNTDIPYTLVSYEVAQDAAVREGAFSFDRLPAGAYSLTLHGTGARLVLPKWRYDDTEHDNSIQPARVELAAGETKTCELAVTVGGTLQGRVTRRDGNPVANAAVTASFIPRNATFVDTVVVKDVSPIYFESDPRAFRRNPTTHCCIRTDGDGRYLLPGLQHGQHRVEVVAEGLATECRLDVPVHDARTTTLTHVLEPAGVLQGIGPAGVTIALRRKGEQRLHCAVQLPDSGLFTVPGLPAATFEVANADDEDQLVLLATVDIVAGRTTWVDLVTAGGDLIWAALCDDVGPIAAATVSAFGQTRHTGPDGTFALRVPAGNNEIELTVVIDGLTWIVQLPHRPVGDPSWPGEVRLGAYEAIVATRDADGQPVAADVALEGRPMQPAGLATVTLSGGQITANEHGEVRLTHLLAGSYTARTQFSDSSEASVTFEVPLPGPIELRAPQSGTVAVTVHDAQGRPRPGVQVHLEYVREAEPQAAASEPLAQPMPEQEQEQETADALTELMQAQLVDLRMLKAFVIDNDGTLRILDSSTPGSRRARTDDAGRAVFTGVPVGEAIVSLPLPRRLRGDPPPAAARAWPGERRVRVWFKGKTDVEFRLPPDTP